MIETDSVYAVGTKTFLLEATFDDPYYWRSQSISFEVEITRDCSTATITTSNESFVLIDPSAAIAGEYYYSGVDAVWTTHFNSDVASCPIMYTCSIDQKPTELMNSCT